MIAFFPEQKKMQRLDLLNSITGENAQRLLLNAIAKAAPPTVIAAFLYLRRKISRSINLFPILISHFYFIRTGRQIFLDLKIPKA